MCGLDGVWWSGLHMQVPRIPWFNCSALSLWACYMMRFTFAHDFAHLAALRLFQCVMTRMQCLQYLDSPRTVVLLASH